MNEWGIGLAWSLFYFIHSLLADNAIKQSIAKKAPQVFTYYRLLYNSLAMLSLIPLVIWQLSIRAPEWFTPISLVSWFLQGLGGIILFLALQNYNLAAFAGIDSWQKSTPNPEPLKTSGLNAWVCHPLYLGVVVILIGFFTGKPHLANFIFMIISFIYLWLGIRLEEAKLLKIYGKDYQIYQQKVKCIVPFIL